MLRLPERFYTRPTLQVARALLGMVLWTEVNGKRTSGRIVEVEAYLGDIDPAAHSFRGRTPRNRAMFETGGTCYVYFIYGMHFCVNVSTRQTGIGEAVLIRAIEPLEGVATMRRRRGLTDIRQLSNGPGKLCQALAVDRRVYGEHFSYSRRIGISPGLRLKHEKIISTPRIGIRRAVKKPWRFLLQSSSFVSDR